MYVLYTILCMNQINNYDTLCQYFTDLIIVDLWCFSAFWCALRFFGIHVVLVTGDGCFTMLTDHYSLLTFTTGTGA